MASPLTLTQLRRIVLTTWDQLAGHCHRHRRLVKLPRPEQQLLFEYTMRLREALQSAAGAPDWNRYVFDASAASPTVLPLAENIGRPHLLLDPRRLLGRDMRERRSATAPDVAVCVHVLRTAPAVIETDANGRPRSPLPPDLRAQGRLLSENVNLLERLSQNACDGFLFVLYFNPYGRRSDVDRREIASWASWNVFNDTLWATSRHFRARNVSGRRQS